MSQSATAYAVHYIDLSLEAVQRTISDSPSAQMLVKIIPLLKQMLSLVQ
jgi:hypothetical protein